MTTVSNSELLGLDNQELTDIAQNFGQPAYRGRQIFTGIYRQHFAELGQFTTLPAELRQNLSEHYRVGLPQIEKKFVSSDGTLRYLIALGDGESVETVWMPEGDDGETGDSEDEQPDRAHRATICISSQVGCAVNCQFCLTALLGVKRSLTAGEIVGQVLAVLKERQAEVAVPRINLVFMGMGEPFLNYDNFMKSVRLLVEGVGIAESRMTVSTAGIIPRIRDFGEEPIRPKLAISLNASNDDLRTRVMPINRKWDLEQLISAARNFPLRPRERLTFEYVLMDHVNDSAEHARELLQLLRGLRCKVNLIALNPGPEIPFATPAEDRVNQFQQLLIRGGIPAFLRRPRGRDIYAACGQLKKTAG